MSTSQTPLENPYLEKSPANGVKARSKLKTLTKPHSVYVRPIVSFSVISAVFVLILLASENAAFRGMPLADAGEWGIATHTITNNVRIVWAVLLAIVSGIFINCLFYIEDLTEAQSSYEVLTGNKSGKITLSKCLNSLAIFLCLVWLIFLISEAHMDGQFSRAHLSYTL